MRQIRPTKLDECRDTHLSSITSGRLAEPETDANWFASHRYLVLCKQGKEPVRAILIANLSHAADQSGLRAD
jgi:hypothetical protein